MKCFQHLLGSHPLRDRPLEMLFFGGGGVRGIVHNNIYSCMGNLTIEYGIVCHVTKTKYHLCQNVSNGPHESAGEANISFIYS